MYALKMATRIISRILRALLIMKWEPVPFFGAALAAMLLYWAALAIVQ